MFLPKLFVFYFFFCDQSGGKCSPTVQLQPTRGQILLFLAPERKARGHIPGCHLPGGTNPFSSFEEGLPQNPMTKPRPTFLVGHERMLYHFIVYCMDTVQ